MYEIAVDIGGTFTDVVCLHDRTTLFSSKVPTTHTDLAEGILRGAGKVLAHAGASPSDVGRFIHSTTIATNAILEHKGAVCGALLSEGFDDLLEIGRQRRSTLYDLFQDPETPSFLAPRHLRAGIRERVTADGSILQPIDEAQVVEVVRRWRDQYQVQAVSVCYLFSFLNPQHERRTRELLQTEFPDLTVSLSSDLDPVVREYERACVSAFDAYVRPRVATYVDDLAKRLRHMGICATFQIMQSRGGLMEFDLVNEKPVTMLLSGPAAGVLAGQQTGALSGYTDLITVDVGGTSCDVALIREGKPLLSRESRIGSYPLRLSMVDVNTVGAGGGSIAWLDDSGGLHVGPHSAGSEPGPACYGRGGQEPTVTDASVVLGYLNPDYFAGGQLALDAAASHAAIGQLARRLSMDVPALAAGIHRIINARMANEIRLVSVKRGHDPRQFALVASGGAGPVHGGRLAQALSIPTELIPAAPGVLCAYGLLVAPVEHEHIQAFRKSVDAVSLETLRSVLEQLDATIRTRSARESIDDALWKVSYAADLRYVGQAYEIDVALDLPLDGDSLARAGASFHQLHERLHGYARPQYPVEIVNLRSVHTSSVEPIVPDHAAASLASLDEALKATRRAYFDEYRDYVDTPVYERSLLSRGTVVAGPAIVEQPDTTTVVYPGRVAHVDAAGNLVIQAKAGDAA